LGSGRIGRILHINGFIFCRVAPSRADPKG
jgi:hypothetical protein